MSIAPTGDGLKNIPLALDGSASDDGLPTGSALTYQWTQVSGPGTVTFSAASALDTNVTASVLGGYTFRLTASDGELAGAAEIAISIASGAYETWQDGEPAYVGLSPEQLAPDADPFSTGVPNLLVYALDLDPLAPVLLEAETVILEGQTRIQMTFLRARADLTYEVYDSSDLSDWRLIATNPGTVGQNVTVTEDTDPSYSDTRRFLRLKVTQ
jgi:hypothetical protein